MNLENVRRDDWILAGLALLLAIDLLFLPWFSVLGFDFTATDTPDGWLGVLAVIAAIAVIVDIGIERLSPATQVPAVGGTRAATRMILVGATALFVALKFLFHIHFSLFGFGFWAGVVLTAALVFFALQARQAETALAGGPGTAGAAGAGRGGAVGPGAGAPGQPGVGQPGAGGGVGQPGAGGGGATGAPGPAGPAETPPSPGGAGAGPGSVGPPGGSGPPPA